MPTPKLDFKCLRVRDAFPVGISNTFVLQRDSWNDFGSHVRFDLYWFDADGVRRNFGKTKILERVEKNGTWKVSEDTTPPLEFQEEIGSDYVSLGQSEEYYRDLHEAFGDAAQDVLVALRDISIKPGLARDFEPSSVFRNGMMRENSAKRSRRFGSAWAQGRNSVERPSFRYLGDPANSEHSFEVNFDFLPADVLPGRVVGIIGKNAVGKTRFMAQLSADLAQIRRLSAESVQDRSARFPDDQPLYTRILAVSYSAFDRFTRPNAHDDSSYVYVGIRDEKGNLSQVGLQRSYAANKRRVRDLGRQSEWVVYIGAILGTDSPLGEVDLRSEIDSSDSESEFLTRLSSGQAILCHFVTGLLAWLQSESLVLVDEPETHLHPNAVANLFVVLTDILRKYGSYAIVATHSPVVIQEIPSKRVILFSIQDGVRHAAPLEAESFGESIAELTEHVFRIHESESLYRGTLDRIAKNYSLDEALGLFDNRLSLNAKAYLLGRYDRKDAK